MPGEQPLFSICRCICGWKRCLATAGAWLLALDIALGGGDFTRGFLHWGVSVDAGSAGLFVWCVGDAACRAVALPLVWCRLRGVGLPVLGKCHEKGGFLKPGVAGPAGSSCALPRDDKKRAAFLSLTEISLNTRNGAGRGLGESQSCSAVSITPFSSR